MSRASSDAEWKAPMNCRIKPIEMCPNIGIFRRLCWQAVICCLDPRPRMEYPYPCRLVTIHTELKVERAEECSLELGAVLHVRRIVDLGLGISGDGRPSRSVGWSRISWPKSILSNRIRIEIPPKKRAGNLICHRRGSHQLKSGQKFGVLPQNVSGENMPKWGSISGI